MYLGYSNFNKKLFQAPNTELNLILINLIVSELAISFVGVPLDLVGTITHGKVLDGVFCPIAAFTHTLFGKWQGINSFWHVFYFTSNLHNFTSFVIAFCI